MVYKYPYPAKRRNNSERSKRWRTLHPKRARAGDIRRRDDRRAVVLAEKLRRGKCSNPDCPLAGLAITADNAVAFDFDHRDRSDKRDVISSLRDRASILAEMAKCDLLCAFCHRLKTHQAGEYMPVLMGDPLVEAYLTLFD